MTSTPERPRAGIYCRLSLAVMGDTTKVEDQERICRDLARTLGWEVTDVYPDNSRSAWQLNRKRPQWDRMLADVDAGRINAIITYHGDRLIRRHEDLIALISLARGKGIRLASPTGERNLDSHDDQFILEIEASMAKRESANISRRQKQRFERWRLEGKVMAQGPGGRRFGFCSDGVTLFPPDRCDTATRAEVSEADIVREIAARTVAGESAGALQADLAARGWTTPAGKVIDRGSIKRMLRNPRYAGLMPDGETCAAWEPVLDRETWERARLAVDARASAYPRDAHPARWLLSGIALCGAPGCGQPLRISYVTSGDRRKGRRYRTVVYACSRRDTGGCGHVYRSAALLDAYVTGRLVSRLNDPRAPEPEVPAAPDHAEEWAALAAERAQAEQLTRDYAASAGRLALLMARLDSIDARMGQLREAEAGDARSRLLDRHRGITREEFELLPLAGKRSLVAAAFRITVLPASRRGPGFRTEDVDVEPLG